MFCESGPGACTMMIDEQIQSYRISFELTKPDHSNLALLVPWCWSFFGKITCEMYDIPSCKQRQQRLQGVWSHFLDMFYA